MTEKVLKDFLAHLVKYYGQPYRPGQAEAILRYLQDDIPDFFAEALEREVEKIPRYGEPLPIIEHFEQAMKVVRAAHFYVPHAPLLDDGDCIPKEQGADMLGDFLGKLAKDGKIIKS